MLILTQVTLVYRHRTPLECGGADIPTPRIAAQAAVFAGDIYVFGGYSWGNIRGEKDHKIVEVYNTRTNTWSRTRDMLTLRRGFRTAVVDGKIYIIGGAIFDRQRDIRVATDLVEVYDPLTERWKKCASSRCQWRNLCAPRFIRGQRFSHAVEAFDTEFRAVNPKDKLSTHWGKLKKSN